MVGFFFLRHGFSEWNHEKRWQGQQDPPLSAEGREQALKWCEAVKQAGNVFDEIWASNLQRATKTAEIIGAELGLEINIDKRLQERHLGDWEGLTRGEIDARWPGAVEKREFPEGSENDDTLLARVLDFVDELLGRAANDANDKKYLIVSHGGVITCLEESLGKDWEQLSNMKGRWIFGEPPYLLEDIKLGEREDFIGSYSNS